MEGQQGHQLQKLGRKAYGPYQILDFVGFDTQPVHEFPFTDVQGGNLSVVLDENVSTSPSGGTYAMAMFEIEIVGVIQGQQDSLMRAWITGLTGPLRLSFQDSDVYETIQVRARNMVGGRPRGNIDPTIPVDNSTAAGFFAKLTVNVQPKRPDYVKPLAPPKGEPLYG